MSRIDPKWENALEHQTDLATLVGYIKEARAALIQAGKDLNKPEVAGLRIRESERQSHPVELLRSILEGIRSLEES